MSQSIHPQVKAWHDELTEALHAIFTRFPPGHAIAFLGSAMANAIGPMDAAIFEEALKESIAPCGEPGCECEKMVVGYFENKTKLFAFLLA